MTQNNEKKKRVQFKNRVYGCIILKSVNSNFNADFTHHPRTLPDGVVYSTDKALKYAIKDYIKKNFANEKLFYVKRLNSSLNPMDLVETYKFEFPESDLKKVEKPTILINLLGFIDVKLFGATFAPKGKDIEKKNISIHGPVQINHGVNRFPENDIYTEDILSPFRNPGKEDSVEKGMSTIGNQTNLKEGHYVFHFSINPKNTDEFYEIINKEKKKEEEKNFLSTEDIEKLKESFNNSVTALDSSRKINTENEATIWIQLIENSRKVLPSLTELIDVRKEDEKRTINCVKVNEIINQIYDEVEKVEIFYNPVLSKIEGFDENTKFKFHNILNGKEITKEKKDV